MTNGMDVLATEGTAEGNAMLVIDHISKSFQAPGNPGAHPGAPGEVPKVLDDISLTVPAGEVVTVIGPSGCGKSTLLSCIAGFLSCTEGEIRIGGTPVRGPGIGRAVVFQQASLLPWRNVHGNVRYGLSLQRQLDKNAIEDRVRAAISLVGLDGYEKYFPHQISGGMQQRVNLARALATRPSLLLMDEPFGALDALTREALQDELMAIVSSEDCTTFFITHDIEEAIFLGDQVVVMSAGPGRIAHQRRIPFPRPRLRDILTDPAFTEIEAELRAMLRQESASAASRESRGRPS